jgi:large subunit ribosomal protein L9
MAKTEVILIHNIVGLGAESDQVRVSTGYARNYLFPQRLAIPLTQANKRRLEVLRQRRAGREAHDLNTMTDLAKSLQKLICVIKVKTGDDGKMFGTVTGGMIADELKTQFDVSLDKKKIHLEHPIRALGEYDVELHLHPDVNGALKLHVESTTPLAVPAAVPTPEEKKEGVKTEKRGRRFQRAEGAEKRPAPDRAAGPERTARPKRAAMTGRVSKPYRAGKAPKAEKPPEAEKAPKAEKVG